MNTMKSKDEGLIYENNVSLISHITTIQSISYWHCSFKIPFFKDSTHQKLNILHM